MSETAEIREQIIEKLLDLQDAEKKHLLEGRKKKKTLIHKKRIPHSENGILIFAVAFYIPMMFYSTFIQDTFPQLSNMVKQIASVVAIASAGGFLFLSVAKGYGERISTAFVELYIKWRDKSKREKRTVQVLKKPLAYWSSVKEDKYDVQDIIQKMRQGKTKDLPLHAAKFFGAYSTEDDFILVTRGLKAADILSVEVTDVAGKWGSGLGDLYPVNIVEEFVNPIPRPGYNDTAPVFFLQGNPTLCDIFGGPGDLIRGLNAKDFVEAASKYGMYSGQYYEEKYRDAEARNLQQAKIIDESREEGIRLAAKWTRTRKSSIAEGLTPDVGEDDEGKKPSPTWKKAKKFLFGSRLKMAFWIIMGSIFVGWLISMIVNFVVMPLLGG